ncbi:hypothetical protein [Amycolatopsis magusensis]|uniref:hypothetical protein n=1 Tax=Amycolatopsis magusensis TaxID=882444 RepID=UPI00379198B0
MRAEALACRKETLALGYPHGTHPHTLAQFARRAGISEGRARAAFADGKLPRPDRTDADGKPLWFAASIDTWCSRTGRAVAEDSLWLFRAPKATEPAVEILRRVVTVYPRGAERTMFAIVWDTDHGHVIYLQPLGNTGGDHKDWMAVAAAELIEPRWWAEAVVVMPVENGLAYYTKFDPIAYVYKLTADTPDGEEDVSGGVLRWLRRGTRTASPARATAQWQTHLPLADIAAAIGRPVPFWITGTTTAENAQRSLAYTATFTVPDTVTEWPATQDRLERAAADKLAERFPAAFAALAADAATGLAAVRTSHERTPDTGPGWYLVARPARPAPPVELEQLITKATPVENLALAAGELTELRAIERDLDIDDPLGDVYTAAIDALARQLRDIENDEDGPYTALAEQDLAIYSAPWEGPVVDSWRRNLVPTDLADARRLRRVQRLLDNGYQRLAREAYRDTDGRYVLVVHLDNGDIWFRAEWPTDLDVLAHWTDETILAGDDSGSVTALLALTPTEDGSLRTDPVPLAPREGYEGFGFGYGGGGPSSTYSALLRVALGVSREEAGRIARAHPGRGLGDGPESQLWTTISTTTGPLRLSWPQVKLWARADRRAAEGDLA